MNVLILGGGSAGLIAAITLLKACQRTQVTIVRSSKIGHIMVGEGTWGTTPDSLHHDLGIPREAFHKQVRPTWKLGVRFLWGQRPYFDYSFHKQLDIKLPNYSSRPLGYHFLHRPWKGISRASECMSANSLPLGALPETEDDLPAQTGYHFENQAFVDYLEKYFSERPGAKIIDAKMTSAKIGEVGIERVFLDNGMELQADLFVDCSGFHGELIHKHLQEPYIGMSDHLFCDRAVVGGWERQEEEGIKPYTTAETMEAGWCWQIEHEFRINRGYVHSSQYLSEDEAVAEFTRKNPRVNEQDIRIVPFKTQRIRRAWVKNVVAIGNACGFVEPLEATNLQVICHHAKYLADSLVIDKDDEQIRNNYNRIIELEWRNIRDFLALHYRFNDRLNTPFWQMATHETPLGELQDFVDFYQKTGPSLLGWSLLPKYDLFDQDSYLTILLGLKVPWHELESDLAFAEQDESLINTFCQGNQLFAKLGPNNETILKSIRSDSFQWN